MKEETMVEKLSYNVLYFTFVWPCWPWFNPRLNESLSEVKICVSWCTRDIKDKMFSKVHLGERWRQVAVLEWRWVRWRSRASTLRSWERSHKWPVLKYDHGWNFCAYFPLGEWGNCENKITLKNKHGCNFDHEVLSGWAWKFKNELVKPIQGHVSVQGIGMGMNQNLFSSLSPWGHGGHKWHNISPSSKVVTLGMVQIWLSMKFVTHTQLRLNPSQLEYTWEVGELHEYHGAHCLIPYVPLGKKIVPFLIWKAMFCNGLPKIYIKHEIFTPEA